jgi:mannose-6-phosphate isomerase-like protein (cupin superfamily)
MMNFPLDGGALSSTHIAGEASLQIFRAAQSECFSVCGHTLRVLLPACAARHRISVLEWQMAARSSWPLHLQNNDSAFVVQKGAFEFTLHGRNFAAQPGDVIYAPRGTTLEFFNRESEDGVLLLIAPGLAWEAFFRDCHQTAFSCPDELSAIAAAHGFVFSPEVAPPPEKTPRFVAHSRTEILQTPHGPCRVLLSACDTGGLWALAQLEIAALAGAPLHRHSREDEIWVVQSGSFEYSNGRQRLRAEAGDAIFGPQHTPHMFRCISTQSGTLLDIVLPGAFAGYFRDSAEMWKNSRMTENNLNRLNSDYGLEFLPAI